MIWLLAIAAAADISPLPDLPPPRPEAVEFVVEGECDRAIPLRVGQPIPTGLIDADGNVTCNGVLLPTGDALHATAVMAWGDAQRSHALGIRARWKGDTSSLRYELDAADATIARLSKPPSFLDRPGTIRALADLRVAGVIAISAYLVVRGSGAN